MERVLLKRDFRTPLGRFAKSVDGVPAEIPTRVLRRYPLPKDAEVVPEGYIPPLEREITDDDNVATAAEQEAEIKRRVDAEIALREAKVRGEKAHGVAKRADEALDKEISTMLSGTVEQVKERIEGLQLVGDIEELIEMEQKGKGRKNVLVLLEARLEDIDTADAA